MGFTSVIREIPIIINPPPRFVELAWSQSPGPPSRHGLHESLRYCSPQKKSMLGKVQFYGIDDDINHWVRVFLINTSQEVIVDGGKSDRAVVASGVPQGTVLGPLLFFMRYQRPITECKVLNQALCRWLPLLPSYKFERGCRNLAKRPPVPIYMGSTMENAI